MYYLGIDLGTSAVKVLLVKKTGEVISSVSEEYPVFKPHHNYSEQNPLDWWNATKKAILSIGKTFDLKLIKALSFGGQMHGLVALNDKGDVIRPAILWNDGRSEKESNYLNNVIGKETLVKYTGNFSFPGFTLPKILWMKENEPQLFNQIKMVLLPKDYLSYCFSGVYASDYSDASGTLLLDVQNKKWSPEMIEISGLKLENLPSLFESYETIGLIKEDVATELGLSKDVKIVAGAGDNAAAAIGTGAVKDGSTNISLGTSGTIFTSSDKFVCDKDVPLHSFAHANGKYHLMGCILSAASANQWWIKNILESDYREELEKITEDDLGNNDVFFAPYLSGERCPHNDVNVRGAFVGLSLSTTKTNMCQAVLEGVSFALKDCFDLITSKGVEIKQLTLCGGGAKNKIWAQMIANIFNVQVNFVETEQGPGYGAAILAMVANNEYASVDEAISHIVKVQKSIFPNKLIVGKYKERHFIFKKIYKGIK